MESEILCLDLEKIKEKLENSEIPPSEKVDYFKRLVLGLLRSVWDETKKTKQLDEPYLPIGVPGLENEKNVKNHQKQILGSTFSERGV